MNYVRIHTGPDGRSQLADERWPLQEGDFTPPSPGGYFITPLVGANDALMMHHPPGYRDAWHTAPAPVLGVVLRGQVRIETSDGDKRLLGPGDQFVAMDLTGDGHLMEAADSEAYDLALVLLKDRLPAAAGAGQ